MGLFFSLDLLGYALMSLASAVFVWRWVPETKGKTLEEMSALWKSGGASR